jgi:hypothetical protein
MGPGCAVRVVHPGLPFCMISKPSLISTAILAAALASQAAHAQAAPERPARVLVVQVLADVQKDCRIAPANANAPDPFASGWQPLSIPSIGCNYAGSPVVRLWSMNNGALAPEGSIALTMATGLAYELRIGGTPVGQPGSANAPLITTLPPFNPLQPRETEIALRFVDPASAQAGDYADTLFLEVIP